MLIQKLLRKLDFTVIEENDIDNEDSPNKKRDDSILKTSVDKIRRKSITSSHDFSIVNNKKPIGKLCTLHNRPLEVICIDHKCKICVNCALFGDHKNHDIRNEEDILKEVQVKAEILIELYELIDTNEQNIDKNVFLTRFLINLFIHLAKT